MGFQSYNLDSISSIRIVPFDSSCIERKYLASCEARYFEISESLAHCIELLSSTGSFAETAGQLSELMGKKYSENDIKEIYRHRILPMMDEQDNERPKMFIWSKELLPSETVGHISRVFRVLFRPVVMGIILLCIIALETIFFVNDMNVSVGDIDMVYIIAIALLFIASSCIHELGHASACSYFGTRPRGIGFGLYLNFPVFYTDVSDIWTLGRKKRMLVNFSGVYFQLIFLIPFFIVYFITGNQLIKYFIYTINLNFIFTLNPFFKFDGYWAMSDFVGVSNLRDKSKSILQYIKNRILRKKTDNIDFIRTMRLRERVVFFVYSIVVNLFFIYYFVFVLPRFIRSFIIEFPEQIKYITKLIAIGEMPSFSLISSIVGQLIMAILMAYFVYRMAAGIVKKNKHE